MGDVTVYAWGDNADEVEAYMHDLARDGRVVLEDGGRALNIGGNSGRYRVAAKGRPRKPVRREG
jgi:hypothetical protein